MAVTIFHKVTNNKVTIINKGEADKVYKARIEEKAHTKRQVLDARRQGTRGNKQTN